MRIEKFNESFNYHIPDTIEKEMFGPGDEILFQRIVKQGYKLYYFDFELGEFINVPINSNGFPYKTYQNEVKNRFGRVIKNTETKKSLKMQNNPFGTLYVMNDEELSNMGDLGNKVSNTLKKIEEQKKLLTDLISSHLHHNVSVKNNNKSNED